MKSINDINEFYELTDQPKPILLDFYANWCGPCQTLMPTVEKISHEFQDDIEVRKVNVDQNRELAAKFGVKSIPSLFFLKGDEILDRTVGLVTANTLIEKVNNMIS
jgi:thioredoxin 1